MLMVRHMIIGGENKCQTEKLKIEKLEGNDLTKSGKKKVELQFNTKSGWLKRKKKVHNYPYMVDNNDKT